MTLKITAIMIVSLLFNACSFRNGIGAFEDIYTDTTVLKPTSKNYKASTSGNSIPIIKEATPLASEPTEKKSINFRKTGRILTSTFDEELKLYLYTFLADDDANQIIFYYDKKLNHPSSMVLDVNILDNYLVTAKKHIDKSSTSIVQKKKYIKHKRKNRNIHEAIEEKINTF